MSSTRWWQSAPVRLNLRARNNLQRFFSAPRHPRRRDGLRSKERGTPDADDQDELVRRRLIGAASMYVALLPDTAEQLGDLLGCCRTGVRLRTGPSRGRLGNGVELVLGHAEVAQTLKASQAGELLDPADRIVRPHRLAQLGELRSDGLLV